MAGNTFDQNLMRTIAAELLLLSGMTASREMFGKSYFFLGAGEKGAVDQAVMGMLGSNYNLMTTEFLAGQDAKAPIGFGVPSGTSVAG
jgi:hypothetical protein